MITAFVSEGSDRGLAEVEELRKEMKERNVSLSLQTYGTLLRYKMQLLPALLGTDATLLWTMNFFLANMYLITEI